MDLIIICAKNFFLENKNKQIQSEKKLKDSQTNIIIRTLLFTWNSVVFGALFSFFSGLCVLFEVVGLW